MIQSEIGFIYYDNKDFVTFVPMKDQKDCVDFNDIITKKLALAHQFHSRIIWLDTLKPYEHKFRMYNALSDTFCIKIIPVRMEYIVEEYDMNRRQMKEQSFIYEMKFKNKLVSLKCLGGIRISVISLKALNFCNKVSYEIP